MDLYHLTTFLKVATECNFTRAAEELSLSQSAVSRHIEALEQEYGLELFARSGRGATLTEAGVRLYEYAERMVRLAREAERALGELRNLESGHLIVGASTTPGKYLLGPVVAAFQERYPGLELRLEIRDSQSVARMVEEGLVDLAVLPHMAFSSGITLEPCLTDELLLVAAPSHPLATREAVHLAELADLRVWLREPGSHTRQVVAEALAARGVGLKNQSEIGSTEAIKQAAATGKGVAFCSRLAVELELRVGLLQSISGPELPLTRQFVIAYPRGGRRPPGALAFASLCRNMQEGQVG